MRTWTHLLTSSALLGSAFGGLVKRDYSAPTDDGFPDPDDEQTRLLEQKAFGKLPGAIPPLGANAASITTFQLIAFNEIWESAYFDSLLHNITDEVEGYQTDKKDELVKIISAVLAQEELHAVGAVNTLQAANAFVPTPCKYEFPFDTLEKSIALAETFTAVVLGALQDATVTFAADPALINAVRVVASIVGQEGEQNGFYRHFLGYVPSEKPFLTFVPGAYAWSILQLGVVPGSCPYDLAEIDLPIFPGLEVNGDTVAVIEPVDQTLTFRADLKDFAAAEEYIGCGADKIFLTYTAGQELPFSVEVEDLEWDGTVVTFKAFFPYEEHVMGGFSHAAITTCKDIESRDYVVENTLAAPAVIQVKN